MNNTFTFDLGDIVIAKVDLEVERQAYPLKKQLLFITPAQIVGRFFFESHTGIEECYHVARHGEIMRYSVEELEPATVLYHLWAGLLAEADAAPKETPSPSKEQLAKSFNRKRFENEPPCYLCGYNGQNYFQPNTHPCAKLYHQKEHP